MNNRKKWVKVFIWIIVVTMVISTVALIAPVLG